MWAEIVAELRHFDSAVLTARDADGYPLSVRCHPLPDPANQTFRVRVGPGLTPRPGPAGLLCHRHDERLWNQRAFLVRGTLAEAADGSAYVFRPTAFVPGAGLGGLRGFVRFIREARRATDRYLAARHLARPRIPWADVNAIKAQVVREERAGKGRP